MTRSLLAALALGGALRGEAPVPRPAPEMKIVEPSGKTTLLSSWRGRVVLLGFISTECSHCHRAALVLEELSREFAGQLQVAAVVFNEGADAAAFRKRWGLSFPVGTSTTDVIHDFLGIERGTRLGTPQMVAIDRTGSIRAQSERLGTPLLQTLDYLRLLVIAMLSAMEEPAR